jgi:hypothetical protein
MIHATLPSGTARQCHRPRRGAASARARALARRVRETLRCHFTPIVHNDIPFMPTRCEFGSGRTIGMKAWLRGWSAPIVTPFTTPIGRGSAETSVMRLPCVTGMCWHSSCQSDTRSKDSAFRTALTMTMREFAGASISTVIPCVAADRAMEVPPAGIVPTDSVHSNRLLLTESLVAGCVLSAAALGRPGRRAGER